MPPKFSIPVFRSGRWSRLEFAPRRANHGHSLPAEEMGQPQDGVAAQQASAELESAQSILREPEDARLTGGTRSLMRRVLGLNVTSGGARPQPVRAVAAYMQPASVA